jgi:hypothetical protein
MKKIFQTEEELTWWQDHNCKMCERDKTCKLKAQVTTAEIPGDILKRMGYIPGIKNWIWTIGCREREQIF